MKFGYQGAVAIDDQEDLIRRPAFDLHVQQRPALGVHHADRARGRWPIAPGGSGSTRRINGRSAARPFRGHSGSTGRGAGFRRKGTVRPGRHGSMPHRSRFPETDGVTGYNDITPRMGFAYDLFGNGKTAVKGDAREVPDSGHEPVHRSSTPTLRLTGAVFAARPGRTS